MIDKPDNMDQIWAESGAIVDPGAAVIDAGWPTLDPATGNPGPPPHTYMNFIQNKMTKFLAHVNEYGIAVWDATTTYTTESWARSPVDNKVYVSTIDNNTGTEPSANPAEWSKFDISANVGDTIEAYETIEVMEARGYLSMNGQAVSRTTYAELFALIGTTFGPGDGSTTFNLPFSLVGTADEFQLFRSDLPANTSSVRVNKNGEMFVVTSSEEISTNEAIAYKYNKPTDTGYVEINLNLQPGVAIRLFLVQFFPDDSVFITGESKDSSGGGTTNYSGMIYEYKNNAIVPITTLNNVAGPPEIGGAIYFFDQDRENFGLTKYINNTSETFLTQTFYHLNVLTELYDDQWATQINDYKNCVTTWPTKKYGNLTYIPEENVSFHFFGNTAVTPSIQSFKISGVNGSTITFSPCSADSSLFGFAPNPDGHPAYFDDAIYNIANPSSTTDPGVVFKTELDGTMTKMFDSLPNHAFAGIYNGDFFTYVKVGNSVQLYKKDRYFRWIKSI